MFINSHRAAGLIAGMMGLLLTMPLQAAAEPWQFCGPMSAKIQAVAEEQPESTTQAMQFTADKADVRESEYFLRGNVVGSRGNQQLSADILRYNAEMDVAQLEGNVRFQTDQRVVVGDSARFKLGEETGQISSARFWLLDSHIRGEAEKITLEGPKVSVLTSAFFTSCDEGSSGWILKASSLRFDTEANEGVAVHARVEFMQVPIFYFPYLSFPLEGRKTGFLVPSVGESSLRGTEFSLPWYWNIAPQMDATITPRLMSRRGLMMQSQFRYLTAFNQGEIAVTHLSADQIAAKDRSSFRFSHRGSPASGWRTKVNYRYVSDGDYLTDFGTDLSKTSVTHLEQRGEVSYNAANWSADLLLQVYQTLDESLPETARPYQRLPQIRLRTVDWQGFGGLHLGMNAEFVQFERNKSVTGSRYDLQPYMSWPIRHAAGFLLPKVVLRHTQYALNNSNPLLDANPSRTLPVISIDSGLFFERKLEGWGFASLQTLEPRLFYLQVPRRQQSDLISDEQTNSRVFDSSLPVFRYSHLFRDNRFSGGDRVADTQQLSTALRSRFFDQQGRERLSLSFGRIMYFQDREVTLPGGQIETHAVSDWVAEASSRWSDRVFSRASFLWDRDNAELRRGSVDWRYQKDKRSILRYGYRYEREKIKQFDLAFTWPVTPHWNIVGRWLHSIKDDVTLETLQGFKYESCCWAVSIVQRNYRRNVADEEWNQTIWLQLELKGLTSVGRKVEDLIARDIARF